MIARQRFDRWHASPGRTTSQQLEPVGKTQEQIGISYEPFLWELGYLLRKSQRRAVTKTALVLHDRTPVSHREVDRPLQTLATPLVDLSGQMPHRTAQMLSIPLSPSGSDVTTSN